MKNVIFAIMATFFLGNTLTFASRIIELESNESNPKTLALLEGGHCSADFAEVPHRLNLAKLKEALLQLAAEPSTEIYLSKNHKWKLDLPCKYDLGRALRILRSPKVEQTFPRNILHESQTPEQFSYAIIDPSESLDNRGYIIPFVRTDR